MPEFGSFCLLLALRLTAFNFLVGSLALWPAGMRWLGRVARHPRGQLESPWRDRPPRRHRQLRRPLLRCVCPGLGRLHQRLLRRVHPRAQQHRAESRLQVCRAVERSGRLAPAVGLSAQRLRLRPAGTPPCRRPPHRLRLRDSGCHPGLLSSAVDYCRNSVLHRAGAGRVRRRGPQPAAAVSRDGDPSADALPRLCRLRRPLRLCPGRADDALSRREVDPHHPPLDHGHLALSHLRHLHGRALGLLCPRLGRLLGLGPGGERHPSCPGSPAPPFSTPS